ncbi:LUD domain-containing protein [Bacteroidales bacterium OttesenSCG-928-K03]|nr:LUD domain-containing protein [Bacteroidales bacterium OttesenSCG-928-L14]MDL2241138.1 LUD domain-containing protein [Bacteroidales bacterium OttesenSCG-928-K22]MDL2242298.1 LUD domain-containing protein [Bacteroidales bacterium OttesenSCG-928-K03]
METKTFIEYAEENSGIEINKAITDNMIRWEKGLNYASSQFSDINLAKAKLVSIKEKNLYNLNSVIGRFEKNFTSNGGQLYIVSNTKDVLDIVNRIIKEEKIKNVLLSKSSTLEEVGIKEAINKKAEEITFTNIAEHIEKISHKKSSHLVSSLVGYNIDECFEIVKEKYEIDDNILTNEGITQFISEKIEKKIEDADMVITGANALIAETGSVVIVENEGNTLKSAAFAKNHIVIAGIDKLLGMIKDLDLLFPMLSTFSMGQKTATYGTIITPTKEKNKNLFVILVNNERTELLKNSNVRSLLRCIKCGACSNVCPVYKKVGGYAYNNAFPGPYGVIASPNIESLKAYKHLPYTSTLCGKCSTVCPVNINIHNLIVNTRNETIEKEVHSLSDEKIIKVLYNKTIKRRKMKSTPFGNFRYVRLLKKPWGNQRELPEFAKNSFSKQFIEQQNNIEKQNNNE